MRAVGTLLLGSGSMDFYNERHPAGRDSATSGRLRQGQLYCMVRMVCAWWRPDSIPVYLSDEHPEFLRSSRSNGYCSVQYVGNNTAGQIYLANDSTGQNFSITLAPPTGATFNGSDAEWIMEAPDGGEPTSSLPSFSPVQFTTATACNNYNNVIGNPENGDYVQRSEQ